MSTDSTIDTNWIKELKDELNYDIFYKDQVENINIIFIYLDNGNIIHIKKINQNINNNCLTDQELYKLILDNKHLQNYTFYINNIIKYNFTLDSDELMHYDDHDDDENIHHNNYLTEHTSNYTIKFEQSIKLFEPLNSLYVVMTTKKSNNKTRRVYISSDHKKTRRKYK